MVGHFEAPGVGFRGYEPYFWITVGTADTGWVHDPDGALLGSFDVPEEGWAGIPCAADLDGDGITEVIRAGGGGTWVGMELDGTEIWRTAMPGDTGAAGCTLGDIDGDGGLEVLVDAGGLTILDAATGAARMDPLEVGYGVQWGGGAMVDLTATVRWSWSSAPTITPTRAAATA